MTRKELQNFNFREFARETGHSIEYVKEGVRRGEIVAEPYRLLGIEHGQQKYAYEIPGSEIARHMAPGIGVDAIQNPAIRNDEIRRQAAAKAARIRQDEIDAGTDANLVASRADERAARELTIRAFKGGLAKDMPEPSTQGFSTAKPDF
jgi:hypothetical protein